MALNWIKDWKRIPIDIILTFDECQFNWIDKKTQQQEWAMLFNMRPYLKEALSIKAPNLKNWIEELSKIQTPKISVNKLREIEISLMKNSLQDFVTYAFDPAIYDNLAFMNWDEQELTKLTNFKNKRVIDIGSGTGKQAFAVAHICKTVYCVEPVGNLRKFILNKARKKNLKNVYVVDGFIQAIPFEDEFADIVTAGHVFGDFPEEELKEMLRVLKPNGKLILIPGNSDKDNDKHKFLIKEGFLFDRFYEPEDGWKRKYWIVKK